MEGWPSWVGLDGTKMVYLGTHLPTKPARRGVTSLMSPAALPLNQTATRISQGKWNLRYQSWVLKHHSLHQWQQFLDHCDDNDDDNNTDCSWRMNLWTGERVWPETILFISRPRHYGQWADIMTVQRTTNHMIQYQVLQQQQQQQWQQQLLLVSQNI